MMNSDCDKCPEKLVCLTRQETICEEQYREEMEAQYERDAYQAELAAEEEYEHRREEERAEEEIRQFEQEQRERHENDSNQTKW